jgi:hypothetical protein
MEFPKVYSPSEFESSLAEMWEKKVSTLHKNLALVKHFISLSLLQMSQESYIPVMHSCSLSGCHGTLPSYEG